MEPKQQKFSVGYLVVTLLALRALQSVFFAPHQENLTFEIPSLAQREYSEETARRIDAEIGKLLEASRARARETLTARRDTLEALAKLLIEREVVDRESLDTLVASTGQEIGAPRC